MRINRNWSEEYTMYKSIEAYMCVKEDHYTLKEVAEDILGCSKIKAQIAIGYGKKLMDKLLS